MKHAVLIAFSMFPLLMPVLSTPMLRAAVVIDRIAAIAGNHVIKLSDVERDVRVTEFLNAEPLALTAEAKKKAVERLIDQALIRDELSTEGYSRASDADAAKLLDQIRKQRFGNSESALRQALSRSGLTEEALHNQLLWQLTVLGFIDQRFRAGVLVTTDEARKYYDEHLSELKRQYPKNSSFEALEQTIKESLEGEQVNKQFEAWLDQTRKQSRVEYRQEALK